MNTIIVIYTGLFGSIFSTGLKEFEVQVNAMYEKSPYTVRTVYRPFFKPFKYEGKYNYIVVGHSLGARQAIKDANENKNVTLSLTLDYVKHIFKGNDLSAKGFGKYVNFVSYDTRAEVLNGAINIEVDVLHHKLDNNSHIRYKMLEIVENNIIRYGKRKRDG